MHEISTSAVIGCRNRCFPTLKTKCIVRNRPLRFNSNFVRLSTDFGFRTDHEISPAVGQPHGDTPSTHSTNQLDQRLTTATDRVAIRMVLNDGSCIFSCRAAWRALSFPLPPAQTVLSNRELAITNLCQTHHHLHLQTTRPKSTQFKEACYLVSRIQWRNDGIT
jgi:hypothetical protein